MLFVDRAYRSSLLPGPAVSGSGRVGARGQSRLPDLAGEAGQRHSRRAAVSLAGSLLLLVAVVVLPGCSGCTRTEQTAASTEVAESPPQQAGDARSEPQPEQGAPPSESDAASGDPQDESSSRSAASDGTGSESSRSGESSSPSDAAPGTPAEAVSRARQLRVRSRRQAAGGRTKEAFLAARDAWELVRRYPDDPACSSLAEGLLAELDTLAGALDRQNGSSGATSADQTLIEK